VETGGPGVVDFQRGREAVEIDGAAAAPGLLRQIEQEQRGQGTGVWLWRVKRTAPQRQDPESVAGTGGAPHLEGQRQLEPAGEGFR